MFKQFEYIEPNHNTNLRSFGYIILLYIWEYINVERSNHLFVYKINIFDYLNSGDGESYGFSHS